MQQLAAFQRALDKLTDEGIRVVAASTDPADKAEETVRSQSLTFPVGYGLDLKETATTLGAFYEERRGILQSTGYLIKTGPNHRRRPVQLRPDRPPRVAGRARTRPAF